MRPNSLDMIFGIDFRGNLSDFLLYKVQEIRLHQEFQEDMAHIHFEDRRRELSIQFD